MGLLSEYRAAVISINEIPHSLLWKLTLKDFLRQGIHWHRQEMNIISLYSI